MLDQHDGLILIVDEYLETSGLLEQAMGPQCSYKYAQDRASALSLTSLLRPNLLLINTALPGNDAFEMCAELRSVPATANLPIIFLLNTPNVQEETTAFSLGAADVLTKPLVPEIVRARLSRCLQAKQRSDQQENLLSLRTVELQVVKKHLVSLTEEQKQRQQEEDNDADLAKSRFLANMSHEFRTPLNGIMGILQILRDSDVSPEHYTLLEMALESSGQLLRLINELLKLSQIETSDLKLKERCYVLREELQPLNAIFSLQAHWKGLEFHSSIDPRLPEKIICDNNGLRQAVINVLDNALKFTEHGSVTFSVAPFTQSSAAELGICSTLSGRLPALLISISDTGTGIPEDKLGAIFEKFDLGEDYITKKFGGSGLGLAIAQKIITHMGGAIWVHSTPGVGSTFYLAVPYGIETPLKDEPPNDTPERPETSPAALRVLIADADPVNQSVASLFLNKHGHQTHTVRDYDSALEVLRTETFDVAIIDLQLPGLDEHSFVQRIRSNQEQGVDANIPIVAVTSRTFYEDMHSALSSGINAVVSKPYQSASLLKAIDNSVALSSTRFHKP